MPLVPITLPPGLYMTGTYYDAKNRWAAANRVRWHNGTLRPIGGYVQARTLANLPIPAVNMAVPVSVARDAFSWVANDGSRYRAFGLNDALTIWAPDDGIYNITPAGFVGSGSLPTISDGYGKWLYGLSAYGARRPVDPAGTPSIWRWSFDTYYT